MSENKNELFERCEDASKKRVKHITKEGSRQHVIHWDTQGRHCSEPNCEVNFEEKSRRKEPFVATKRSRKLRCK